jgi:hypothetical protein
MSSSLIIPALWPITPPGCSTCKPSRPLGWDPRAPLSIAIIRTNQDFSGLPIGVGSCLRQEKQPRVPTLAGIRSRSLSRDAQAVLHITVFEESLELDDRRSLGFDAGEWSFSTGMLEESPRMSNSLTCFMGDAPPRSSARNLGWNAWCFALPILAGPGASRHLAQSTVAVGFMGLDAGEWLFLPGMLESHRCQHADEVVDKVRVNGVGSRYLRRQHQGAGSWLHQRVGHGWWGLTWVDAYTTATSRPRNLCGGLVVVVATFA